ncbi:aminoglycoside phosphotransferase [Paenibacillus sp. FSL H8-0548]|nr:aminoglycoside phosphotransferase [Paenibacillus sp. FSL H8-0548]
MDRMIGLKIGEGGCSEVYEWDNNQTIIKIGKNNTSFDAMKKEFHNNQIVWGNGLPSPRPYEFLDIDGRPAIVFERIYGVSLMERYFKVFMQPSSEEANKEKKIDEIVRMTAQVLSDIHSRSNLSLPPQREMMKYSIQAPLYLTLAEKDQIIEHLDRLPMKQQLCHGDPNPGNMMIQGDEVVLIDWMNASIGNPEADLAEYVIMIRHAILPPRVPNDAVLFFDSIRERILQVFWEEYNRSSEITCKEVEEWVLPIAARKLCADGISEAEKELLLTEIRSRL